MAPIPPLQHDEPEHPEPHTYQTDNRSSVQEQGNDADCRSREADLRERAYLFDLTPVMSTGIAHAVPELEVRLLPGLTRTEYWMWPTKQWMAWIGVRQLGKKQSQANLPSDALALLAATDAATREFALLTNDDQSGGVDRDKRVGRLCDGHLQVTLYGLQQGCRRGHTLCPQKVPCVGFERVPPGANPSWP